MNVWKRVIQSEEEIESEKKEASITDVQESEDESADKEASQLPSHENFKFQIDLEILYACIPNEIDVALAYDICFGNNWNLTKGIPKGSTFLNQNCDPNSDKIYYNKLLELEFETSSLRDSPAIIITAIGYDCLCRQTILGYSTMNLVLVSGHHTVEA